MPKQEKKGLTDIEIYNKTVNFGWRRIVLYFEGAAVSLVVLLFFSLVDRFLAKIAGINSNFVITWIGLGLALFAFFFIAILPIAPMRASHTAIMTEAILNNNIPQPCIEEGMEIAQKTYPVMSFLLLFAEIFKSIKELFLIKDPAKRSDLKPKIASMAMFLCCSMVPYIGTCAMSWAFCHQEKKTKEALLKGGHLFLMKFKNLIGFMIINAIAVLAACILIVVALSKLLYQFFETNPFFMKLGIEVLKDKTYLEMGFNPIEAGVVYMVSLFLVYFLWIFIRPICTIGVLRNYYSSMSEEDKKELFAGKADIRG